MSLFKVCSDRLRHVGSGDPSNLEVLRILIPQQMVHGISVEHSIYCVEAMYIALDHYLD